MDLQTLVTVLRVLAVLACLFSAVVLVALFPRRVPPRGQAGSAVRARYLALVAMLAAATYASVEQIVLNTASTGARASSTLLASLVVLWAVWLTVRNDDDEPRGCGWVRRVRAALAARRR